MPKTNVGGIPAESVLHVVPDVAHHYLYLSSGIVIRFDPSNGQVMGAARLPTEEMVFDAIKQPEHPRK